MKTFQENILSACTLCILTTITSSLVAGGLEPSGPPAPTMKTLDEVEPRIPINADNTPGDATYEFIIKKSGSYYLTENVGSGTSKGGIRIDVDDVTVDLMGYTMKGPNSGTNDGIYMNNRNNVEVRNGTIRSFQYGIKEAGGGGQNHRIIDVRLISNTVCGIYLNGTSHIVKDCTVKNNGDSASVKVYGVYVKGNCTVTGNSVTQNGRYAEQPVYGIHAYYGCTVSGNTANGNGFQAKNSVYGIYADGSTIIGNTSNGNGQTAPVVYGIYAGEGCTVIGNTANENGYGTPNFVYGIYLYGYDLVDQNTAYNNGPAATITNMDLTISTCVYGKNVAPVVPQ